MMIDHIKEMHRRLSTLPRAPRKVSVSSDTWDRLVASYSPIHSDLTGVRPRSIYGLEVVVDESLGVGEWKIAEGVKTGV